MATKHSSLGRRVLRDSCRAILYGSCRLVVRIAWRNCLGAIFWLEQQSDSHKSQRLIEENQKLDYACGVNNFANPHDLDRRGPRSGSLPGKNGREKFFARKSRATL